MASWFWTILACMSLNKHVVLISGFSEPYSEFQIDCERIHNKDVCNSCYNRHTFDPVNGTSVLTIMTLYVQRVLRQICSKNQSIKS